MDTICETLPIYNLSGLTDPNHPGGTWTGSGVVNDFFNPSGLIGNVPLTFTPSENCGQPTDTYIFVRPSAPPDLGTDVVCESNGLYDLIILEDPLYGGFWSGPGVIGTDEFDPIGHTGMVTLTFTPVGSCASVDTTDIEVIPEIDISSNISQTLCFGESLTINGVLYDQNNPSGSDTIFGGSYKGCDSLLSINLDFSKC